MSYTSIIIRSAAAFLALFITCRLMGKKQLGHLTFFNYAAGITIGSIAAAVSLDGSVPVGQGLTSLAVWACLTMLLGFAALKFSRVRVLIDDEPTVVIKNGQIMQKALKGLKMNMDDLSMLLRRENAFNITDVEYAVFEPDGKLSVLKKAERQNVTRQDMKIPAPASKYLASELIVDGNVMEKNLQEFNLDRNWLEKQINSQGYAKVEDIFYAELQTDGSVYLDPKNNK